MKSEIRRTKSCWSQGSQVTVWTQVAAGMAEGLRNLLAVLIQAAVLAHGAAVAQANASATWGMVKEGHPEYVSIYACMYIYIYTYIVGFNGI